MSFGRKKEDDDAAAAAAAAASKDKSSSSAGEPKTPAAPAAPAPAAPTTAATTRDPSAPKDTAQKTTDDDVVPPPLSDAELAALPPHVRDAAAKDGSVVRAAPKGGEGTLGRSVDSAYPELEPPVPASEFRAAPTAPGARPERESWGDARLTAADVETVGTVVEVRTKDPNSAGVYAGGVRVLPDAHDESVDLVRARSAEHLAQLLTDPRVEVRVKPTK